MKQAFKKKYDFGDANKYRLFLKRHLTKVVPRFYGVAACRAVDTTDGPMYALQIVLDIENPNFEPIAEAWINDEFIYLWRDHCWAVAVDKQGCKIVKEDYCSGDPFANMVINDINTIPVPCNKVLLVHRVGLSEVE
jgi:hypothetical protein